MKDDEGFKTRYNAFLESHNRFRSHVLGNENFLNMRDYEREYPEFQAALYESTILPITVSTAIKILAPRRYAGGDIGVWAISGAAGYLSTLVVNQINQRAKSNFQMLRNSDTYNYFVTLGQNMERKYIGGMVDGMKDPRANPRTWVMPTSGRRLDGDYERQQYEDLLVRLFQDLKQTRSAVVSYAEREFQVSWSPNYKVSDDNQGLVDYVRNIETVLEGDISKLEEMAGTGYPFSSPQDNKKKRSFPHNAFSNPNKGPIDMIWEPPPNEYWDSLKRQDMPAQDTPRIAFEPDPDTSRMAYGVAPYLA